jgi:hypothetical protein
VHIVAAGIAPRDPGAALKFALGSLLPGVDTQALEKALLADAASQATDAPANPRARALRMAGLVLGSPEFQKH